MQQRPNDACKWRLSSSLSLLLNVRVALEWQHSDTAGRGRAGLAVRSPRLADVRPCWCTNPRVIPPSSPSSPPHLIRRVIVRRAAAQTRRFEIAAASDRRGTVRPDGRTAQRHTRTTIHTCDRGGEEWVRHMCAIRTVESRSQRTRAAHTDGPLRQSKSRLPLALPSSHRRNSLTHRSVGSPRMGNKCGVSMGWCCC